MIRKPDLTLYQFPFSHYCEKARWALQFKNADFRTVNVPPGLHKIMIKRKAPGSKPPITVPLLTAGTETIQGSGRIIDYIDRAIPEKQLGFEDETLRKESRELEAFLDDPVGTSLRSIAYHILLKNRKTLISLWCMDGPFYTRAWLTLTLPHIARMIERMYQTGPAQISGHKDRFNSGMDRLDDLCESKPFLVGGRFSRTDLTLAAILAPLNFPEAHPYRHPVPMPDEFQRFCEEQAHRPVLKRVMDLYREYRINH